MYILCMYILSSILTSMLANKNKHVYDETVDEYICELDISKIVFVEI
jgi:hypothetical protein